MVIAVGTNNDTGGSPDTRNVPSVFTGEFHSPQFSQCNFCEFFNMDQATFVRNCIMRSRKHIIPSLQTKQLSYSTQNPKHKGNFEEIRTNLWRLSQRQILTKVLMKSSKLMKIMKTARSSIVECKLFQIRYGLLKEAINVYNEHMFLCKF